jgi:hypothetical protein
MSDDDAEILKKMIKTLVRMRKREAEQNLDTYYLSEAIKAISDLHEMKGFGEIK